MKSQQRITALLLSAILFSALSCPLVLAYTSEAEPEITIEVYVNDYDEEYIRNIDLGDGTVIGDHSYQILYIQPKARSNNLEEYFHYVAWITRDEGISLSLNPMEDVRRNASVRESAWNLLKDPWFGVGGSSNWYNEEGLRDQYDCHAAFAPTKEFWNLEPWRPVVSWAIMIRDSCNPE